MLLLVAANIANLALARVIGRERELALRSALGAGPRPHRAPTADREHAARGRRRRARAPGRLARPRSAASPSPPASRRAPRKSRSTASSLAFTFGVSVFTGLLFGLLPAFTRRTDASVQDAGHRTVGSRRLGARNALIVAQVAISFMLLVGAGLLVRSFIKLQQVDAGFRTDRVLTALVSLDFVKCDDAGRAARRSTARCSTRSRPNLGVETAALGITAPLDQAAPFLTGFIVEGQAPDEKRGQAASTSSSRRPTTSRRSA